MKLNQDSVWTISKSQYNILKTIEYHSKSHDYVPLQLLQKHKNINPYLHDLTRSKFIRFQNIPNISYKITTSGYDCLAITSLRKKGMTAMGSSIGIGKECDLYYATFQHRPVAVKFHRIGRTSFRSVKNNRDYHQNKEYLSWHQLSKISAECEFNYMKMFKDVKEISAQVPEVIMCDRHVVMMELLDDFELLNCARGFDVDIVYEEMMLFIENLWNAGYVHGDYNEFNIMIKGNQIMVIDYPQTVRNTHERAIEYVRRDIDNVRIFFERKFRYKSDVQPNIENLNY